MFLPPLTFRPPHVLALALAWSAVASVPACAPGAAYPPNQTSSAADSSRAAGGAEGATEAAGVRGLARIVEVYGDRTVRVGEAVNYRIRLEPGFAWPIEYTWDFGDGIVSVGNNVAHRYKRPGRYTLTVTARNDVGSDTAQITVTVEGESPPALLDVPTAPVAAAAPFRPGDIVWVAGIYSQPEAASEWASAFAATGLRSAVLPTMQGGREAYLVAVGGYRTEAEAHQARAEVLRARDTPLWLLQLDELRRPQ